MKLTGPIFLTFLMVLSDPALAQSRSPLPYGGTRKDGSAHSGWLQEQKQYRVIRFWNDDVLHNVEAVLARIVEALEPPP